MCPNVVANVFNKMNRKRKLFNFGTPRRLVLLLNVGKINGQTFIGSSPNSGNHWVRCHCRATSLQTYHILRHACLGSPFKHCRGDKQLHKPHTPCRKLRQFCLLHSLLPFGNVPSVRIRVRLEMSKLPSSVMY